jgi:glycosyltransferase involved in cell wall biosynthesis
MTASDGRGATAPVSNRPGQGRGKRILVGCFEIPGYGGASTATYGLYRRLLASGLEVSLVNFILKRDVFFFRHHFGETAGNPERLPGVRTWPVRDNWADRDSELTSFIREQSPDLLLGVGYIGARILMEAAPDLPLVFLTVGCRQSQAYLERGVRDERALLRVLRGRGRWPLPERQEPRVVARADLVITHSDQTKEHICRFYPEWTGKVHPEVVWFAEWIQEEALDHADLRRAFERREIDVLFIASDWRRPEKNWPLVRKIVRQLAGAQVHVVGEVPVELPDVVTEGLVTDHGQVFALMGNAKTVVCPSRLDSAPGILFEASAMGCNVVTSKNAGNWRLCHPDLLVDPPRVANYASRIRRSLKQKLPDGIDFFLGRESYAELVEILRVF